jgi:hypothetical protein
MSKSDNESPKKISTIHEMDRDYNDKSNSRYKYRSDAGNGENRFMTAHSKSSNQIKERKNSLIQKKQKLQDEVRGLKEKLERKREQSMSRSKLGLSRRSVSRLTGSERKGFKNVKKRKNNKMLIEEIKR